MLSPKRSRPTGHKLSHALRAVKSRTIQVKKGKKSEPGEFPWTDARSLLARSACFRRDGSCWKASSRYGWAAAPLTVLVERAGEVCGVTRFLIPALSAGTWQRRAELLLVRWV